MDDDFMEMGDSGLFSCGGGWVYDQTNNFLISPDGEVFDEEWNAIASFDMLEADDDQ